MINSPPALASPLDSKPIVRCPDGLDLAMNISPFYLQSVANCRDAAKIAFWIGGGVMTNYYDRGVRNIRVPIEYDKIIPGGLGAAVNAGALDSLVIDNLKLYSDTMKETYGFRCLNLDAWHGSALDSSQTWTTTLQSNSTARARFADFWYEVAGALGDYYDAFNLINEDRFPYTAAGIAAHESLMLSAGQAVRSQAPGSILVIPGVEYSSGRGLAAMTPLDLDNVVYEFHDYTPFVMTHGQVTFLAGTLFEDLEFIDTICPPTQDWYSGLPGVSAAVQGLIDEYMDGYAIHGSVEGIVGATVQNVVDWSRFNGVPVTCGEFGCFCRFERDSVRRYYRYISRVLVRGGIGRCLFPTSLEGYWNREYQQFLDYSAVYPAAGVWGNLVWEAIGYVEDESGFDYGAPMNRFPIPRGIVGGQAGSFDVTAPEGGGGGRTGGAGGASL